MINIAKSQKHTESKIEPLDTNRHYRTNDYDSSVVYGEYDPICDSAYSDRFDLDRWRRALGDADGKAKTAAWYENALRQYWGDDSLELVWVVSGINRTSGYPYNVFGWICGGEKNV